jgi:hypothetical protein
MKKQSKKPLFIEPIKNGPDSTMKTLQRLIELLQSNGITVEDDLGVTTDNQKIVNGKKPTRQ